MLDKNIPGVFIAINPFVVRLNKEYSWNAIVGNSQKADKQSEATITKNARLKSSLEIDKAKKLKNKKIVGIVCERIVKSEKRTEKKSDFLLGFFTEINS